MKGRKTAILYETHLWNTDIENEFQQISNIDYFDSWLLLDSRTPQLDTIRMGVQHCYVFDVNQLFNLPYPRLAVCPNSLPFGHAHFPVLSFYLTHPEYEDYWFIEYDVRYSGNWRNFFAEFSKYPHDLITSHIRSFQEEPDWGWWRTFSHPDISLPRNLWLRSFNVIYRISNQALACLHQCLPEGWCGHHEVLVVTALKYHGLSLLDFGGDGSFALPNLYNSTYISSNSPNGTLSDSLHGATLRWRPVMTSAGPLPDKLYHPVRDI